LLLSLIREIGWPLTRSRVHLSPFSSVKDNGERAALSITEDEGLPRSQNKSTIMIKAAMARLIKTTLPLREDKSLRILDIIADVISFIFDRFYLKKTA